MKKQGTRIISLFIILMLFIGFIPETCLPRLFTIKAHAEEIPAAFSLEESPLGKEMQDGQWSYALREKDGYAVVTGYDGKESTISVPEYLGGYDVVGVASDALTAQTQVTLPGTVYYLAEDAFGKTKPEIVAPNGSYVLWWAAAHDCTYRTGKDYELVPSVIDYTEASSWRVRKRGESNVSFDALTAMPLKVGSLFLMRDTRGMDFFFRVAELHPEDGGMLATVEVPEVSKVFINYETTVDVALTRDDFIPAEGVTVERNSSLLRSVSSGSDTTTTPISASISGKTKGGMKWSGSAGGNFKETVTYTVTIVNGEITNTELTKTESNEYFIKLECSGSTKILGEINKARELAEKKAKGETITEEEYDWLDDFRLGLQFGKFSSDPLSLEDLEEYDDALDAYYDAIEAASHINETSKLGEYRLQTPYFNISIRADVSFSVSGALTYTFTDNTVTKQHYDPIAEEWVIDDVYSSVFSGDTTHSLTAQIQGNISFKIELSVGAVFLSNLSAEFEVGIEATAKKVIALNGRKFNNCTECTIAPFAAFNAYAGVWVGKNYGAKVQIYSNEWTAQDLLGKEYLWKAHVNAALSPTVHYPQDCPLKDTYTVHFQTRSGITVNDRDVFPGGALTSAYNPNLNEDQKVSSQSWLAGAFLGWAWNPTDTTPTAAAVGESFRNPEGGSTPFVPTADCTVYDVWENMATVSFDSNGGSAVDAQLVPLGGHALRPNDPIKEEQHLLAWKTQDDATWNFARDMVSADITLTADWGNGSAEPGGTEGYWYIGDYNDVSDDCKIDPYREGQSGAYYFQYTEIENAIGIKGIRITGLKNDPVHLVVPARLPSLSIENATLEVIDIADGAFAHSTSLRSAYFLTDDNKQFSAYSMFSGCTNLEYVEAPALENGIGDWNIFAGCTSLRCVKIRSGTRGFGVGAFSGTGIRSLSIPFGITDVSSFAFRDCTSLASLDLGSVESISESAFSGCTALESLYIPDSVKIIYVGSGISSSWGPFRGCTALKSISIGGIETIENTMFDTGSAVLETLTIRGTVRTIGSDAFSGCDLTTLIICEGVENIYSGAFSGCGLTTVSIPSTVKTIGDRAFSGCGLTTISIPSTIKTIGKEAFFHCTNLTSVILNEGIETIGAYAFAGCGITKISIPLTVKTIEEATFSGCSNLKSVKLNSRVKSIASYAFSDCTSLVTIDLDGVESISSKAFQNCTSLESLYIPDSVKQLEVEYSSETMYNHAYRLFGPFYGCSSLKTISIGGIEALSPGMLRTGSNVLEKLTIRGTVKTIENNAFFSSSDPTEQGKNNGYNFTNDLPVALVIEEGVELIGSHAFYGCSAFTSIAIPSTVHTIEQYAFAKCNALTSIFIPPTVDTIGACAFFECHNLESAVLKNVKSIGDSSFAYCPKLRELDLEGVESIPHGAFYGCRSLNNIYIPDNVLLSGNPFDSCIDLETISIGCINGLNTLNIGMFLGDLNECPQLKELTIRGTVKKITKDDGYYVYLTNEHYPYLSSSLIIGDGVEEIDDGTFSHCSGITSVSIPSTIKAIGNSAFSDCTNLKDIIVLCSGQPFSPDTLNGCENLTIHIGSEENQALEVYCKEHGIPYDYTREVHILRLTLNNSEHDIVQSIGWAEPLELSTPIWEGHIFAGWFFDEALTERCTLEAMPARDLTLYAAWHDVSDNINYRVDGDHVTLLRHMALEDEDSVLYLPDTVNGLPLTAIAAGAFTDSNVKELHIPASVTEIAINAFAGSTLLRFSVSADNRVYRSINSVIYSKDGTELLFFPPSMRYSMTIPAGVTRVGSYAFAGSQVDGVTFNEGLLEIGEHAFQNTQLTELTLPESVETIGEQAFSGCGDLHYIEAAGSPITIGDNAFGGCSPFLSVYGPNEDCELRTAIRNGGYRYNAYTLTLEAPLRTIKRVCDAGTELLLPTSPETAENERFTGWFVDSAWMEPFAETAMPAQDLTLYAGTAQVFDYVQRMGQCITACHAPGGEISVPESIGGDFVTSIAAGAFGSDFTKVTLPDYIGEIETGAFAANTVLICAPGSSTEAAARAAGYNIGARSWTLRWESGFAMTPNSAQLSAGEVIVAPNIERSGYELTGWYYDEDHTEALTEGNVMPAHDVTLYADWNVIDEEVAQIADNLRWTLSGDTVTVTGYTGTGTDLSIPASLHGKTVTVIAPNAFAYNNSVTEIVLPDTVATLGEKAFFSMRNLSSLTLPAGLKTLPADVLNGCTSLETITLPEGLESIAGNALANSGLTELNLPASLMTIDSSALRGCAALSEILVVSGNPYFESRDGVLFDTADGILVKYPAAKTDMNYTVSNVWSIGAWAFENAQALQEVIIDAEIYSLGTGAFRNCTGLTVLPELGEYVSKIPDECFYGCASLSSETLSESVRELGRYALANSGLSELTVSNNLTRIGAFAIGSEVLLRGETGCYAETWASENGVVFIPTSAATVEIITLLETRIALNLGARTALTPTVTPAEAGSGNLQYLSADESIVRVDENGQIYAVGGGTTTVFISAPGGAEASCIVTVVVPQDRSGTWGELTWTLSINGVLTITGSGPMDEFSALEEEQEETRAWRPYLNDINTVIIENDIISVGNSAFTDCINLNSATIPVSVTIIGDSAFSNCNSLSDVYFGGTQTQWSTITVDSGNDPLSTAEVHYLNIDSGIAIVENIFPDSAFRSYVSKNCDTDKDGYLSEEEIAAVTAIDVSGTYDEPGSITSLKGIEYFTALQNLSCGNNQLTSLDVSHNTALQFLNCYNNKLTELNVSNNAALDYLYCQMNQLFSLDVSDCIALQYLYCDNNHLTGLNVSNNTALIWLYCHDNQLAGLNVSSNSTLERLGCWNNQLTSLDVSHNTALKDLECGSNQLSSLDVSRNTTLENLDCQDNQLASLNVSDITSLHSLSCNINQLTNLDLSDNINLSFLCCHSNQLTSLILSNNIALEHLDCASNQLISVDLSNNTTVEWLDCFRNQLTALDVSQCPRLVSLIESTTPTLDNIVSYGPDESGRFLRYDEGVTLSSSLAPDFGVEINVTNFSDSFFRSYISANFDIDKDGFLSDEELTAVTEINVSGSSLSEPGPITSLKGVEFFVALKTLNCTNNQLTELDISKNVLLENLQCGFSVGNYYLGNQLTKLDLSNNPELQYLYCDNNQLTQLDISKNAKLVVLMCSRNKLTELDVSNNRELCWLYCWGNQLTELDVDSNTKLALFSCAQNQLTELDISNNPGLIELYCNNNQMTDLDVSSCAGLQKLSCSNNQLTTLNITGCIGITNLYCSWNQLDAIDITGCAEMQAFECGSNPLGSLNLSKNTALTHLGCFENQLTELDLSNNTDLQEIWCYGNLLERLDFTNCSDLTLLSCHSNLLKDLILGYNAGLQRLWCFNNQLRCLDISACTSLMQLTANTQPTVLDDDILYENSTEDVYLAFRYDESVMLIPYDADFILPSALTEIGEEAFVGGAFTFVKLPENAALIGRHAFADCPNLTYVYIPAATTQIDPDAFGSRQNLTIIGKSNTTAETYAIAHNYNFIEFP